MAAMRLVLGSKRASISLLVVTDVTRLRFFSSAVGSVSRADVGGAERLDAVLRAIGDQHVLAGKRAMVLGREIRQELQRAGRLRDDALDLAPAGPHLHVELLAAQHVRLAERASGDRQRLRGHHGVAFAVHAR